MAGQGSKVKESGGTQAKANSWLISSWTELPIGCIAVQSQTWDSASRKQHFHTDHEPALLTQFLALIILRTSAKKLLQVSKQTWFTLQKLQSGHSGVRKIYNVAWV